MLPDLLRERAKARSAEADDRPTEAILAHYRRRARRQGDNGTRHFFRLVSRRPFPRDGSVRLGPIAYPIFFGRAQKHT
jgi:hypothetical protein